MSGGQGRDMGGCNNDRGIYRDRLTFGTGGCGGGTVDITFDTRCNIDIGAVAKNCYAGYYDIELQIHNFIDDGATYSSPVKYFVAIKETSGTDTYRII